MEPNYTPEPQPYQRRRRADRYLTAEQAAPEAAAPETLQPQPASSAQPAAAPAEARTQPQRQPLKAVVSGDEAAAQSKQREPIRVARPSGVQINARPEPGRRDYSESRPDRQQRSPIIVAGSDHPRAPVPPQTGSPYGRAVQPTASQLPHMQHVPEANPSPRSAQPRSAAAVRQRQTGYAPAAGEAIERASSSDHMLQSPSRSKPLEAPVPRWIIAAVMCAILVAAGAFTGGLLMDAYLQKQQAARAEAFQRVVDGHPIQYLDLIQRYSMEYNLQPAFVASIILNESSYNTHAQSNVGARGLMQLMPDTAKWIAHKLGLDATYNVEQLWTAETNIRFGCWYLNYLSKQFGGDAVTVASAYHTGQGEVSAWLSNRTYAPDGRALSLSGMPEGPTKVYAGRVTRDYAIYDALYFKTFND